MTTQPSIVAQQVRLRQWAEQVQACRNRPEGMDVETWCNQNNITKANYYYRPRRVREACLEQIPETPAFVEIPMADHVPAKSSEKLPAMNGQPLLRIHNRAGISIEIFQDMPAEKLQSLAEALAYVQWCQWFKKALSGHRLYGSSA